MAVARTGAGTELTMAAFNGPPVPVKMQNMAMPSAGSMVARGPKKQSTPNGTVSSADHAETRYSARPFVRSQRCATHPPTALPPGTPAPVPPPPDRRPAQSRAGRNPPQRDSHRVLRKPRTLEETRHPRRNSTQRKRDRRHPQRRVKIRWIATQRHVDVFNKVQRANNRIPQPR